MTDNITKDFTVIIDRYVHMFIREICTKHDLAADELNQIWMETIASGDSIVIVKGCDYIFKKGKMRGTKCVNKVNNTSEEFCSIHKKIKKKTAADAATKTSALTVEEEKITELDWSNDAAFDEKLDDLISNMM